MVLPRTEVMTSTRRSSRSTQVVDYAEMVDPKGEYTDEDRSPISNPTKRIKIENQDDTSREESSEEEEVVIPTVSKPWETADLSEYERNILMKIEERNKFMVAMGFPEAVRDLNAILPQKVIEQKPKIKQKKPRTPKQIPPPREPSRRLRDRIANRKFEAVEETKIEEENQVIVEEVDNRLLDTMKMEKFLEVKVNCDVSYNPDVNLSTCNIAQYKDQLASMKFLKFAKMNRGKIQSLHLHSSWPNPLIFSGDKFGNFSVWRPNFAENADDEVITYSCHRAGLNCISTSLEDESILYTTSFDGTILKVDMNKGQFTNVFASDFEERISHLTWHDEFQPGKFLIAHGRGDVGVLDSAAGKTVQQWVDCFIRSVKTVHHHPTQSHYFVAASGTGKVKIFDLRNSTNCIAEIIHGRSVASAFFSPDGNWLLTNSHDDKIRVFETSTISSSLNQTASFCHNNHTGLWVTPFKAVWAPQRNDVFHIGSMMKGPRRVRFYNARAQQLMMDLFDESNMDTICSSISMHPQFPILAGANSSGKVFLFGPPDLFKKN
uniref:WD repeat-containing protein 76 n=1 Tax=Lygus hesperus TaxID=30085 RepID=A0A146KVK2_LYGHE